MDGSGRYRERESCSASEPRGLAPYSPTYCCGDSRKACSSFCGLPHKTAVGDVPVSQEPRKGGRGCLLLLFFFSPPGCDRLIVRAGPARCLVSLGDTYRRAGNHHPCIDALEQVLEMRVLVSDTAPHPRTLRHGRGSRGAVVNSGSGSHLPEKTDRPTDRLRRCADQLPLGYLKPQFNLIFNNLDTPSDRKWAPIGIR